MSWSGFSGLVLFLVLGGMLIATARTVLGADERRMTLAARGLLEIVIAGYLLTLVLGTIGLLLDARGAALGGSTLGGVQLTPRYLALFGAAKGGWTGTPALPHQLIEMYGSHAMLDSSPGLRVMLVDPTTGQRLVAWGLVALQVLITVIPYALLRQIFDRAAHGNAMTLATARLWRWLGLYYVVAIAAIPLGRIAMGALLRAAGARAGFADIAVGAAGASLAMAVVLLAVAAIWREACPPSPESTLAPAGGAPTLPPPVRA